MHTKIYNSNKIVTQFPIRVKTQFSQIRKNRKIWKKSGMIPRPLSLNEWRRRQTYHIPFDGIPCQMPEALGEQGL